MTATTLTTLVDGVISVAVIAASVVLVSLSKIDATTAVALIGVAITLVGGSAKALLALHVPAPAQPVPAAPPTTLAQP